MAFVHSKNSVFSIDDTGGLPRILSQYVDNVSGLPGNRDLSEVTAFGDQGTKNIPGLVNTSFSISGHFDNTAVSGPDVVLGGLMTGQTATATFEYGPEGSTTGKIKYSGECWITSYTAESGVGDKVSFSAEFQVDGVVTRGAYA
jgi:hypothetical protein